MTNREELLQALAQLDTAGFEEVISTAFRQRYPDVVESAGPDPQASAPSYAQWIAKRHLASDLALDRVVYLPENSPEQEIRLLEVNRFLNPPDPDVIEPLDFTPDTDSPFRVFVADITMDQWERIQQTRGSLLPSDWTTKGHVIISRG